MAQALQMVAEADSRVAMALSERPWNVRSSIGDRLNYQVVDIPEVWGGPILHLMDEDPMMQLIRRETFGIWDDYDLG